MPEVLIDPAVLEGLRRELGDDAPAIIGDMLASFRADGLVQLAAFDGAADAAGMAKAAHRLRGSALNLGAIALAAICQRAESLANGGDAAGCQACAGEMRRILELTDKALA